MEGLVTMLQIEAHRVDGRKCVPDRVAGRRVLANVGLNQLKSRWTCGEDAFAALRMPRRNPHRISMIQQVPNDASAQEPRATEDHNLIH
jgi:hypothetical protein